MTDRLKPVVHVTPDYDRGGTKWFRTKTAAKEYAKEYAKASGRGGWSMLSLPAEALEDMLGQRSFDELIVAISPEGEPSDDTTGENDD